MHENPSLLSATHHVVSAASTGKGYDPLGPMYLKHALVAERPRRTTLRLPLSALGDMGNAAAYRPLPREAISTGCPAFDEQRNAVAIVELVQHVGDGLLVGVVTPAAYENSHPTI